VGIQLFHWSCGDYTHRLLKFGYKNSESILKANLSPGCKTVHRKAHYFS
jgi:hypothetical protein